MAKAIPIDQKRLDAIIERWGADPSFVIEMLEDVQEELRHLPEAALKRVSERTGADLGRLYHIATFYKAFSLEPRGEVPIQVCTGTACHVQGAPRVMEAFARELHIEPGQTTEDLKFSLEGVRCLGCCSLAPVVVMGKDLHGGIVSSRVRTVLKRYAKGGGKKASADAEGQEEAGNA
jgi:NADH-quinone oxidoreductase subunit E